MPKFTDYFIERVRTATDIVAIINRHVPLKKSGGDFAACCPFHKEKSPSFTVSPRKKIFHCFGCEEGGDIFKFLTKFKGIGFQEAVLELAGELGFEPEYEQPAPKKNLPPKPSTPEGEPAPTATNEHPSDPSTLVEAGLEAAVPASNPEDSDAHTSANPPLDSAEVSLSPWNEVEKPSPLERFYRELILTATDLAELQTKRGLSEHIIAKLGFKSNHLPNRSILKALAGEYGIEELVRCGLWKRGDKRERGREVRPTGQFYGWGVVAKHSNKDEDGEADYDELDTNEFKWAQKESGKCNPILIPYFDDEGKLVALRPHKGFPKGQKPRLYIAQTVIGARVVITEGEFKAAALADVLKDWSVASLPGVSMSKNFNVWGDVLAWLKRADAREVVIAFDNEEKGDPKLPGYKVEFEKRFEAQVWARVLAARLDREDYRASIATLPDDWRNGSGKADWDSVLGHLVKQHAGQSPAEAARAIRHDFENVLATALRAWEFRQMNLFDSDVEWVISDRAALLSYESGLPWGGKSEKRIAKELRVLARALYKANDANDNPLNISARLIALAEAYEKTWGWYYVLKLTDSSREKLNFGLMAAKGSDQISAYKTLLKGTPNPIAPFRLTPYYVLLKPTGRRERLVRMVNVRGEDSGLVALPSKDFTAPRDWRSWLADRGNYGWEGGERELQTLQRDMNYKLARREVKQLVFYGCDRPDGLCFFNDVALGDEVEVRPDKEGIFWDKRQGYTYLRNEDGIPIGDEEQVFRLNQCLPKMHPGMALRLKNEKFVLEEGDDDPEAVQQLTGELASRLEDSFSSLDGLLLLAAFCSWVAAPSIYKARGEFPGTWIVGEKGSGKNVAAKVGMAMWGYAALDQTMSFKASTTVNAIITLGQLANMPNWGDEYKEGQLKEEMVRNIVHCGFNREIPGKFSPDGMTRKIRTNWLVTGESTCANAATMDRFLTVVAAKENWKGTQEQKHERFEWLLEHRPFFFTIIRAMLRRRRDFVETMMQTLAEWERIPELATAEPRGKFAHGVAYGALLALTRIIPILPSPKLAQFRDWAVQRTMTASREVQQQVNVNQFLTDLLSGLKSGAFGETPADLRKLFRARENKHAVPCGTLEQIRAGLSEHGARTKFYWPSYHLYLQPEPVISMLRAHLHRSGQRLALNQLDLRRQLEARPFWVKPPLYSSMHKMLFSGQTAENCWCFEVDKMPDIGRRDVTDEEFEASKFKDGDIAGGDFLGMNDQWIDPRKGDLFYLIDLLLKKSKEGE